MLRHNRDFIKYLHVLQFMYHIKLFHSGPKLSFNGAKWGDSNSLSRSRAQQDLTTEANTKSNLH
jgi:hypothetical protein